MPRHSHSHRDRESRRHRNREAIDPNFLLCSGEEFEGISPDAMDLDVDAQRTETSYQMTLGPGEPPEISGSSSGLHTATEFQSGTLS